MLAHCRAPTSVSVDKKSNNSKLKFLLKLNYFLGWNAILNMDLYLIDPDKETKLIAETGIIALAWLSILKLLQNLPSLDGMQWAK